MMKSVTPMSGNIRANAPERTLTSSGGTWYESLDIQIQRVYRGSSIAMGFHGHGSPHTNSAPSGPSSGVRLLARGWVSAGAVKPIGMSG